MINTDQISGVLRIVVPAACAWLAARGFSWFSDQAVAANLVTLIVAIAALVWSYFDHSNAAKLKKVAALDPAVQVTVPQSLIAADPGVAKVVGDRDVPNVDAIDIPPKV